MIILCILLLLLLSQVTLYVPGLVLRCGINTVLLMEQVSNCSLMILCSL